MVGEWYGYNDWGNCLFGSCNCPKKVKLGHCQDFKEEDEWSRMEIDGVFVGDPRNYDGYRLVIF
jgi:hypothetical protein